MSVIKLVIADDHIIFLEGLTSLLKSLDWIHIVGTAHNGAEALELLKSNEVDLLMTDINMPDLNGVELCQQVQKLYPHIPVLTLTMHGESKIIHNMLRAGAKGYILKNTHSDELMKAIKAVASAQNYIGQDVKKALEERDLAKERKTEFMPKLSKREQEILRLVAKELTTAQIAEMLFISHHTVITHRKKLLFKFNVQNSAGLIKRAAENGLID